MSLNILFTDFLGMNLPYKIYQINGDTVYHGSQDTGVWYIHVSTMKSQNWTLLSEKQRIAELLKDPAAKVVNTEYNDWIILYNIYMASLLNHVQGGYKSIVLKSILPHVTLRILCVTGARH